jgi:hypothetical protein
MPNMTPLTPPTTAPADRLDLTEASVRTEAVQTPAIYTPCIPACFAGDE